MTYVELVDDVWARERALGEVCPPHARAAKRRLAVILAVVGPGIITSNVDNDAGGITTYTLAGAQFGYKLLWVLIPLTIALYVSEEMCARMGVVTGKGLSDLIREEFGFRSTFFVMAAALLVDLGNTVAEFAGVAASMEIFGVSKYISVPMAAIVVWFLVVRGSYSSVEKIFLVACAFYLSYVVSAFLAKPDWLLAAKETVRAELQPAKRLPADVHRLGGNHHRPVAIFLFAGGLRRKARGRQAVQTRAAGCARRQHHLHGHRILRNRLHRGHAARPRHDQHHLRRGSRQSPRAAGRTLGRRTCSLSAYSMRRYSPPRFLPLSTAHVICEGLGFEAGIDRQDPEAPIFYGLYAGLIVAGGGHDPDPARAAVQNPAACRRWRTAFGCRSF